MNYIITAFVLIAYELNLFFQIKKLFGYKAYEYKKPFDCFFCLSVWANTITTTTLIILNYSQYKSYLTGWAVLIILSKIIDLLWNKN